MLVGTLSLKAKFTDLACIRPRWYGEIHEILVHGLLSLPLRLPFRFRRVQGVGYALGVPEFFRNVFQQLRGAHVVWNLML